MTRTLALVLALSLVGGGAWGCATTGSGDSDSGVTLSATRYSAADLARLPHDNLYDLFRQHHRVRVGRSTDRSPLRVRHRGSYVPARLSVDGSEVANPLSLLRQTSPRVLAHLVIRNPREASSVRGDQGLFAVIAIATR